MKIYDGHMHIGGSAAPNPAQLMEKLEACGISGGCVISIDPDDPGFTFEQRMENLFAWVKGWEDRLFPVAWLHPYEPDIFWKLENCAARGVAAFKFIPSNYSVGEELPRQVFRRIEELGFPIIFHSGILYDFQVSSKNNMPANWENFIDFQSLRFSMAHCAHPWSDECVMVYGKFRWVYEHLRAAVEGKPTIYKEYPWIREHIHTAEGTVNFSAPELYLDTTPGAHGAFRRDMLRKICSCYPDGQRMMFGTDGYVENYPADKVRKLLAEEKKILDAAGASKQFRENMYCRGLFRFLGKQAEE